MEFILCNDGEKLVVSVMYEISIIIVNYKSKELIRSLLKRLEKFLPTLLLAKSELIIVNNTPTEVLKFLQRSTINVRIINNKKNIGFGKAVNQGAKLASGNYLLILNPDTTVLSDFLSPLISFVKGNKKSGIISPRLLISRNIYQQYGFGEIPNFWNILKNKFRIGQKVTTHKDILKCDWVAGTCMFMKRSLFNKLRGFDEKFFLYFEDADLCLRAKQIGLENYVINKAKIIHKGGAIIDKNKKYYYKSQDYFNSKYYGVLYSNVFRAIRGIYKNSSFLLLVAILPFISALFYFLDTFVLTILMAFTVFFSFAIYCLLRPYKIWYLVMFLIPLQFSVYNSHYIPFNRVLIPTFSIMVTINFLIKKRRLHIPLNIFSLSIIALISLMAISLLATKQIQGIGKLFFLLTMFPFYYICLNLLRSNSNPRHLVERILKILINSSVIINIIGIGTFLSQFLFDINSIINFYLSYFGKFLWSNDLTQDMITNNSWLVEFRGGILMRCISIFPSPHQYAFYLAIVTPLLMSLTLYSYTERKKLFLNRGYLHIAIILSLSVTMLTFSRGAYISLFISSILPGYILLKNLLPRLRLLFLYVGLSTILILIITVGPIFQDRIVNILNINEPSNAERVIFFEKSTSIFKDNWLTGSGYGLFDEVTKFKGYAQEIKINAHNTYIELGVELGFLGGIAGLIIFLSPLLLLFNRREIKFIKKDPFLYWILIGILSSGIWLLISSFFETLLYSPIMIPLFMFIMALLSFILEKFKISYKYQL